MRITKIIKRVGSLDYQYLFLELILIICGILIAFWIDTRWNEYQEEKQVENYLGALHIELSDVQKEYQQRIDLLSADISHTRILLNHINEGSASLSKDSLLTLLWQIRPPERFSPNRSALDDLINSGGLSLLNSDNMRRTISSYVKTIEEDVKLQEEILSELRAQTIDHLYPHIDFSELLPEGGIHGKTEKELIQIPQMKFATEASGLFTKDFSNYLVNRTIQVTKLLRSHHTALRENEVTSMLIQNRLEGNSDNAQSF